MSSTNPTPDGDQPVAALATDGCARSHTPALQAAITRPASLARLATGTARESIQLSTWEWEGGLTVRGPHPQPAFTPCPSVLSARDAHNQRRRRLRRRRSNMSPIRPPGSSRLPEARA